MDFRSLLLNEFVFLDGGMGTMLHLSSGELPERLNLTNPVRVSAVHKAYAEAGSQIVYANTFGANPLKLAGTGVDPEASIRAAVQLAKDAVGEGVCVALDIGPTGQLLPPAGQMTFEAAYASFRTMCEAGAAAGADLIVIETMSDLLETKAAVLAAKESTDLPVIVTMTFTENGRTFTGCPISAAAMTLEGLGVSAIGINCSLGPKEILPMIPPNVAVGLRVYGHRTGFTPKQSCTASQLVSPIQTNNAANIYARLNSISAVGWTPITYSLKQAAYYDFEVSPAKKRIILISDGGENCDESPCDFIINLQKYRDDIRIDVIALAIGDQDANNQLKCVALVTSGKFYNANTAADLKNSLQNTLNLQKEVQGVILNQ